jgi:glycosyltransferase involved in cell wall biosynthesis
MEKKLLVFASTFPRWKNDTLPPFVYELSKRLTDKFDVSVLAPSFPGAKDFEVMDKMKVYRFHYFLKRYEKLAGSGGILPTLKKNPLFYFQVPFFLAGEYLALKRAIKTIRPDIIHAHWIIPQGWIASLMPKKHRTNYVVTTWGGDMFVFKKEGFISNSLKKLFGKIIDNSKNATSVNKVFLNEMRSVSRFPKKIFYIPNGIDTKLFNPNKKDLAIKKKYKIEGPFLLFVGRLAEKKGVKYLLDAMPEVLKQNPKTKLMIIGTGPLEKELKHQTRDLKIEKNVIFMGAIQNSLLPKYYATADIFIGPSIVAEGGDREGFPTVFLEAMSSEIPILTTRIEGINEIIKEGKNGFIVNQKSSKEIIEKITYLLKSRRILERIGKISRKIAKEKYDWSIINKEYVGVLG